MRKTRAHPPKDRKVEDLRHFRRVIRDAVRALDESFAPRWQDGVELTLAGRIRALVANEVLDKRILREALASSTAPLDRSASSGAVGSSAAPGAVSPAQRESVAEAPARKLDG